ncbi:MAG: nuclear transport factor 2 family protein [Myxococcota bacterium]
MNARIPLSALSFLALGALAAGCADDTDTPVETPDPTPEAPAQTPKEFVLESFTTLFTDVDVEAAAEFLAEDYIQHNPFVPTGAAPVLEVLPALQESGLTATTHRVIAEGDLVVLHTTYGNADFFGAPTLVAFDMFRVEDGKLAEHWDNLQAPPETTVSGRSMTDGPTEVVDLELTADNKAHVEAFANAVLLGGDFDRLPEFIISEPGAYLQHNPDLGDGLDGLAAGFAALAEDGRAITYTEVHFVVAEGNFVYTMSGGTMGEDPTAFFDLFRLEDGLIVEHWDTIATIPPADAFAHPNGKF